MDSRLKDYNSSMIIGHHGGFSHYAMDEKKLLIHQKPIEEQKKSLFWAFFYNDENYIYEFDQNALSFRRQFFIKMFSLGLTTVSYFILSNIIFAKVIKKDVTISKNMKYFYFLGINVPPLIYFCFDFNKTLNVTDEFLYKKYLKPFHLKKEEKFA